MRRLVAVEELKTNISCYEDIEKAVGADKLKQVVSSVVAMMFRRVMPKYIVDKYLTVDDIGGNLKVVRNFNCCDVIDCIRGDSDIDLAWLGKDVIRRLRLKVDSNADMMELGKKILDVFENKNYSLSDMKELKNSIEMVLGRVCSNYAEYFDDDVSEVVDNIYDLLDVEDNVGDKIAMHDVVDFNTRDNAFLCLDDNIIWSKEGQTHTEALIDYNKKRDNHITYSDDFGRLSMNEIQNKNNVDSIAFGHYGNEVVVIDDYMKNCDADDVVDSLKRQNDKKVSKVYCKGFNTCTVERVAHKKLLKK